MKKGQQQMMWILISMALALAVLIVYMVITGTTVRDVMGTISAKSEESTDQLACSVVPWTNGDRDGDGIKDLAKCEKYTKNEDTG